MYSNLYIKKSFTSIFNMYNIPSINFVNKVNKIKINISTFNFPNIILYLISNLQVVDTKVFTSNMILLVQFQSKILYPFARIRNLISIKYFLIFVTYIIMANTIIMFFGLQNYVIYLRFIFLFLAVPLIILFIWTLFSLNLNKVINKINIHKILMILNKRAINILICLGAIFLLIMGLKLLPDYIANNPYINCINNNFVFILIAMFDFFKPTVLLCQDEFSTYLADNTIDPKKTLAECSMELRKPENRLLLEKLNKIADINRYIMRENVPLSYYNYAMNALHFKIELANRIFDIASSNRISPEHLALDIHERGLKNRIIRKPNVIDGIAEISTTQYQSDRVLGGLLAMRECKNYVLAHEIGCAVTNVIMSRYHEVVIENGKIKKIKNFNYQVHYKDIKGDISREARKAFIDSYTRDDTLSRQSRYRSPDDTSFDNLNVTNNNIGWSKITNDILKKNRNGS